MQTGRPMETDRHPMQSWADLCWWTGDVCRSMGNFMQTYADKWADLCRQMSRPMQTNRQADADRWVDRCRQTGSPMETDGQANADRQTGLCRQMGWPMQTDRQTWVRGWPTAQQCNEGIGRRLIPHSWRFLARSPLLESLRVEHILSWVCLGQFLIKPALLQKKKKNNTYTQTCSHAGIYTSVEEQNDQWTVFWWCT